MSSMALKLINLLILTLYITAKVSGQCTMSYKYGPDCRYDCHCAPGETCTSNTRCTCANGWDGPTCQRQNVALGRPTNQSSTWASTYQSSVAVDGSVGHNLESVPCTHTQLNDPATWEVTLDRAYTIARFRIYNRAGPDAKRLNGFKIYVFSSSGGVSTCYTDTTTSNNGPGGIINDECQDGSTGNRVQISISDNYLTLCEVLLFVCSDGTYGANCQNYCGECIDTIVCDKKTGICPVTAGGRCKEGSTGEKCDTCVPGYYGDTCRSPCGQCQNTECNRQTGSCPTCKSGYMEPLCTVCVDGMWGLTCSSQCGNCVNNPCDKADGTCPLLNGNPRCTAGYEGNLCVNQCGARKWGTDCKYSCGQCLNGNNCDPRSGICPANDSGVRCAVNFKGDKCIECDDGNWGIDCSKDCGACKNGNKCNKQSGNCGVIPDSSTCVAGYKGSNCDIGCDDGKWGEDCSQTCGQCTIVPCDKTNGNCQIPVDSPTCLDGYKGIGCRESNCSQTTYGPGCKYDCHCRNDITCDPFLGCDGRCAAGWDGPTCQRQNVALQRPTSQSSIYTPFNPALLSRYAVDGILIHNIYQGCSHTAENDLSPTWTVTLEKTYNIYRFRIYNRDQAKIGGNWGNRLNGFTLAVGTSSVDYSVCYQDNTTSLDGPGKIVDGTCQNGSPISGNRVQIRNRSNGFVCLCEVLLYVCSIGWYGDVCHMKCTENDRCKACDDMGLYCKECFPGQWGEHCDLRCGNCLSGKCVKGTGICPLDEGGSRCKAGYKGENCTTPCSPRTWGQDCTQNCGNCFNDAFCQPASGSCPTETPMCLPGYEKPLCSDPCAKGTWGSDCEGKCGMCFQTSACGAVRGDCPDNVPLCDKGFTGNLCNTTCEPGKYGLDCAEDCGSCADGPTSCHHETGVCPFKQGQILCMDGFTGEACNTKTPSNVGAIVGPIIAVLVVIVIVVAGIILYRRRKNPNKYPEDVVPSTHSAHSSPKDPRYVANQNDVVLEVSHNDTVDVYENEISTAVPVEEFAEYVKQKKAAGRFKSEFEKFPEGLHAEYKAADLPHNKAKSRYRNLVAYDHSRVILQGGPDADYINACYINGFNEPQKFIASQGPTDLIIKEFVRMIWEKKAETVVMVTNLVEATKTKCVQYWPNQGTRRIGEIDVTLVGEEAYANFIIRSLRLTHSEEKTRALEVKQLHFTTWPDHGVPTSATALLEFRDKVLAQETPENGPMVVHCSAGIGRTGTFIALDYLINQAKAEGALDVPGCVRELRKQRVNMIQTKEQYEFLHEALVEALRLTQGSIPSVDFAKVYAQLCTVDQTTGRTHMAREFQNLEEYTPAMDRSKMSAALKQENASKNRSKNVLAADSYRPFLSTPVTGCNDYINAVFLPGYRMKRGFILTQTPLPNTVLDFWRLVYEQSISTIVMLDQPDTRDKSVGNHLPEKGASLLPFDVEVISEENMRNFSVWTYQLTYKNTKVARPIKHVRCKFWSGKPSTDSIPSLLSVIQFVEDNQKQGEAEPVLVYCRDGVTKSGLYCAASSVIERLKVDQDVNIVQTLKQLRTCRPCIVSDQDQFDLLHQLVLGYLDSFNTYANFSA